MHLLYSQVLNDRSPAERSQGLEAGLAWLRKAEAVVLYVDYGVSLGMQLAADTAVKAGIPVEQRHLDDLRLPALAANGPCAKCGQEHPLLFAERATSQDKYGIDVSSVKQICATCLRAKEEGSANNSPKLLERQQRKS